MGFPQPTSLHSARCPPGSPGYRVRGETSGWRHPWECHVFASQQRQGPAGRGGGVGTRPPAAGPWPRVRLSLPSGRPRALLPRLSVGSDRPSCWQLFGLNPNASDKLDKAERLAPGLVSTKASHPTIAPRGSGAPSADCVSGEKRETFALRAARPRVAAARGDTCPEGTRWGGHFPRSRPGLRDWNPPEGARTNTQTRDATPGSGVSKVTLHPSR